MVAFADTSVRSSASTSESAYPRFRDAILSTKYFDDEIYPFSGGRGLVYFGHRYYSPELGRFISRDPIGEHGGINLHTFVRNAPTIFYDSLGEKTEYCQVWWVFGRFVFPFPIHFYVTIGRTPYALYEGSGVINVDGPEAWPPPTYWIDCRDIEPPACMTEDEFDAKMLEAVASSDQQYRIPFHVCIHWVMEVLRDGRRLAESEISEKREECIDRGWNWREADDPDDCCYCGEE